MGKTEYLEALKRAMTGIGPDKQAATLAFYEQRFVDGVLAGRTEAEIDAELEDPKKIAMTLRASTYMKAFDERKNPANFVRMAFAAVALLVFNLVMIVPAIVYASLLASLYGFGLALYLYGVVITASGLSGATEIKLDGPFSNLIVNERKADGTQKRSEVRRQTKVAISGANIQIYEEPVADANPDGDERRPANMLRRAEQVATIGVKFNTDMDEASRTTQTFFGFGLVLGGILTLLLCLVVTRYTFIATKRYIEMNFSLLKGN